MPLWLRPASISAALLCAVPAFAQEIPTDGRTCFCLSGTDEQLLRGCTAIKPRADFYATATCVDAEGARTEPLTVTPEWTALTAQDDRCSPCQPPATRRVNCGELIGAAVFDSAGNRLATVSDVVQVLSDNTVMAFLSVLGSEKVVAVPLDQLAIFANGDLELAGDNAAEALEDAPAFDPDQAVSLVSGWNSGQLWGQSVELSVAEDDRPRGETAAPSPSEPWEGDRRAAYWNGWFEEFEEPIEAEWLEPDHPYTFVLDFSAYDYTLGPASVFGGGASDELLAQLDEALAAGARGLQVWARPVLIGAKVVEPDGGNKLVQLLLEPLTREPTAEETSAWEGFQSGDLPLQDFARQARAGFVGRLSDRQPFTLDLQTQVAGCGAVALSVWDASGRLPLDHLIFRFRIGEPDAAAASCEPGAMAQPFEGGMRSLLSTALGEQAADSPAITAALHVFEVEDVVDRPIALAVFAAAQPVQPATPTVLSWQLAEPLSPYLATHFPPALQAAQAAALGVGARSTAYSDVARALKDHLFSAASERPDDQAAANGAFERLRALASQEQRPTVLARLVGADGELLYLPLRLLSAGGDEAPLPGDLRALQPLPRERFTSARTCVDPWAFGLPPNLVALPPDMREAVRTAAWLRQLIEDLPALETYFAPQTPALLMDRPGASEGLLLVAHQASGALWFTEQSQALTSGAIGRSYAPGSAAILASCAGAGIDGDNRLILERLNQKGVDTLIASPFQVNARFGAEIARELAERILAYRTNPEERAPPLLADLFDEASLAAAEKLARQGRFADMRFEFEVLGDHGARLCPAQPAP